MVDRNDNQKKVTLEFDVTDLPAISHAFSIASTTAMMCGHPGAQKRLRQYKDVVEQLIPEAARIFEGEVWCEVGMAITSATSYSVHFEKWGYSWSEKDKPGSDHGLIQVTIGNKHWNSDDFRIRKDSGKIEAVKDLLHSIAPLDAVHVELPDTDFNDRHKPKAGSEPKPQAKATVRPVESYDDDGDDYSYNP